MVASISRIDSTNRDLRCLLSCPEPFDVERVADNAAQFGCGIAEADGQLEIAVFFNQPDPITFGHVAVVFAQEDANRLVLMPDVERFFVDNAVLVQGSPAQVRVDVSELFADAYYVG